MTVWYRARFLFCSFGPLYLLLCVGLAVQHQWTWVGLTDTDKIAMAIAAGAFLLSIAVFNNLRKGFSSSSPSRYAVQPIDTLDESVISYMLSYIPPLMIDDLDSLAKIAPAIVFYIVLLIILFRTNTMYVNPYFLIFKYRIFRVVLPSNRSAVVITKRAELVAGETITLYAIESSKLYFVPESE